MTKNKELFENIEKNDFRSNESCWEVELNSLFLAEISNRPRHTFLSPSSINSLYLLMNLNISDLLLSFRFLRLVKISLNLLVKDLKSRSQILARGELVEYFPVRSLHLLEIEPALSRFESSLSFIFGSNTRMISIIIIKFW